MRAAQIFVARARCARSGRCELAQHLVAARLGAADHALDRLDLADARRERLRPHDAGAETGGDERRLDRGDRVRLARVPSLRQAEVVVGAEVAQHLAQPLGRAGGPRSALRPRGRTTSKARSTKSHPDVLDDAVRLHLGDDVGEQRRIGGGRVVADQRRRRDVVEDGRKVGGAGGRRLRQVGGSGLACCHAGSVGCPPRRRTAAVGLAFVHCLFYHAPRHSASEK